MSSQLRTIPACIRPRTNQDSRHYAVAAKLPMLEPADSAEALAFVGAAYALSEQFDTPVLLKMCTRISHSQSIVETAERKVQPKKPYEKNAPKYIMMPGYAKLRHPVVEKRMESLTAYAETTPLNRVEKGDGSIGIITSSACYQYVKEVFGDRADVLKLGLVNLCPNSLF